MTIIKQSVAALAAKGRKGKFPVPDEKINELKEKAKELRKTALTMIYEAQSGHPGGSFSRG